MVVLPTRVAGCLVPSGWPSPRVDSLLLIALRLFRVLGMPSFRWALECVSSIARMRFRRDRGCFKLVHLGVLLMHNVQENCFLKYLSRGHDISLDICRFDRGWAMCFKTKGSAEVRHFHFEP